VKNKRLDAIIKKAAAQVNVDRAKKPRFIDPTLVATAKPETDTPDGLEDRKQFFKEMKRREF
jgi:spore coat polysaccharide biosynthesis protein SpsF (cytidylyltransferase family)